MEKHQLFSRKIAGVFCDIILARCYNIVIIDCDEVVVIC